MVRTRTSVMSAEAVAPVSTLGRRTRGLFTVLSMRWRVNPYSVFVDVGAVLNKLRFAWRGCCRRWCVSVGPKRGDQCHRKNEFRETFHSDFPCLSKKLRFDKSPRARHRVELSQLVAGCYQLNNKL